MTQAYCVKCRKVVEVKDPKRVEFKNGRGAIAGTCPISGTKVFRIIKWQDDPIYALELAIVREKKGEEFYLKAAERTDEPMGKKMYKWLANEEAWHQAACRHQLEHLMDKKTWKEWKEKEAPILESEFPAEHEPPGAYSAPTEEVEGLKIAIKAERSDIDYYEKNRSHAKNPEAKKMFDWLVKQEQDHLKVMKEQLKWINRGHKYFRLTRFIT